MRIGADLVSALRSHRAEQSARRLRTIGWGDGWGESFVFTSPTGGPMAAPAFARHLGMAGKAAGIDKRVTPHVLRHTVGTNMRAAGVPLVVVAQVLGHTDQTTTARYYDHPLDGEASAAADRLAEVFG